MNIDPPLTEEELTIVRGFDNARRSSTALTEFPGTNIPSSLTNAYRIQNALIDRWPDELAGWKVGQIPEDLQAPLQSDRLAGPIFASTIRLDQGHTESMPIFVGGFAAIEAEFVAKIRQDCPENKRDWSLDDAFEIIESVHIGIEIASSPLQDINGFGPCAVVCGYGNNSGLLVGPAIESWQDKELNELTTKSLIEGREVGEGSAANLKGGILRSVQFAAAHANQNALPLKQGQYIATGQTNGIHEVLSGQQACCVFEPFGQLSTTLVPA